MSHVHVGKETNFGSKVNNIWKRENGIYDVWQMLKEAYPSQAESQRTKPFLPIECAR